MSANGARHRRFPTTLTAAFLATAILGSAGPARAQFAFDDAILPPRVVAWRLADRGFTPLGRPRFDGRGYVVEAVGPGGARLRLFLDPVDGAILGRQRLDPPMIAFNRPAAPGYGWTEDDARFPPSGAAVAGAARARPDPRPDLRPEAGMPGVARVPAIDGIDGLNPERAGRPEAPRRSARLAPPEKPRPTVRTAPEAPRPAAPEASRPEPTPPKPARSEPADKAGAASAAPRPTPENSTNAQGGAPNAAPAPASRRAEAAWKDPPAEGGRKVRVIGGATVVPGTTDKDGDKEPAAR